MGKRPLIGISGSHNAEDHLLSIKETYTQAVFRAGGLPILLPETADETQVCEMLDHLDGLILAGGGDILPSRFGEETLPECGVIDESRDIFELLITPLALKRQMPVFGICRGVQVLAVALGGTLYQDIPSQCSLPEANHRQSAPYSAFHHTVHFTEGSLFARIVGTTQMPTNSMHHQSVKDPGKHLIVEGKTEDGVIEALRHKDDDGVFGVQFHPEYLAEHSAYAARLFEHFVKKADAYRLSHHA